MPAAKTKICRKSLMSGLPVRLARGDGPSDVWRFTKEGACQEPCIHPSLHPVALDSISLICVETHVRQLGVPVGVRVLVWNPVYVLVQLSEAACPPAISCHRRQRAVSHCVLRSMHPLPSD